MKTTVYQSCYVLARRVGLVLCGVGLLITPVQALDVLSLDYPARIGLIGLTGLSNNAIRDFSLQAQGQAFAANDLCTLQFYSDSQDDASTAQHCQARVGGNLAVDSMRAFSSVELQTNIRLSLLRRLELFATANQDASELYLQIKTTEGIEQNRLFRATYQLNHWQAWGPQISGAWQVGELFGGGLRVGGSVALLTATKLQNDNFQVTLLNQAASGRAQRTSSNLKRNFAGFDVSNGAAAEGSGYALDLGLTWRGANGLQIDWTANDLLAQLSWNDIATDTFNYNNANKNEINGEGQVVRSSFQFRPAVKHGLVMTMPITSSAMSSLELQDSWHAGVHFPSVSLIQQLAENWQAQFSYEFRFRSVGLRLLSPWFYFGVQTDRLNLSRAYALGVSVGLRYVH